MLARLAAVAAVLLAAAPVAHADSALEGGKMQVTLWLPEPGNPGAFQVPETTEDAEEYFNRAHCIASTSASIEFAVHIEYSTQPTTEPNQDVDIWTGEDCNTQDAQESSCGPRNSEGNPEPESVTTQQIADTVDVALSVADLVNSTSPTANCNADERTYTVWAIIDNNSDFTSEDEEQLKIEVDTEQPPLPPRFTTVTGAEAAIQLAWEEPEEGTTDIEYYQVLCAHYDANGGLLVGFDEPTDEPRYQRTQDLVPNLIDTVAVTPMAVGDGAAGMVSGLPDDFLQLDPRYICGETAGTATGIRIEGLENDEDYVFLLVAVDHERNYTIGGVNAVVTPVPATDFWEDLDDDNDNIEGGFCLIADTYGNGSGPGGALTDALRRFRDETLAASAAGRWLTAAYYEHVAPLGALAQGSVVARVAFAIVLLPFVALALAWHVLTLPGLLAVIAAAVLLRRARKRLIVAAAIAASLPATASAQEWDQDPYWDDEFAAEDEVTPDDIKWHVGLKLGPYTPEIDEQSGMDTYERMFGEYEILPVLDIDRVVLHTRLGQLGVGGSIGFFGKTAYAFVEGTDVRSEGDQTKLRIIPLSLQGVFRLTVLDDEMGIPLVPYVRGGLSYYTWWIRKPSGRLGRVYEDDNGMPCDRGTPGCNTNRALGASLGFQGTIGLSVRAEQLDPDGAASMRSSGMYHAGFYAELTMAKVDGFGSESKLSVGDTTWFAGIDFEF